MRPKRVSDPLDDRVKARLLSCADHHPTISGSASSGSEHNADEGDADADLAFLDLDEPFAESQDRELDHPHRSSSSAAAQKVREMLDAARIPDGGFCLQLRAEVNRAAAELASLRSSAAWFRRGVMARLRWAGYNAGLCKARWEGRDGALTAGSYDYIDVVASYGGGGGERYIVDLDFAAQFAVARATEEYEEVAASMPRVMVGRSAEVMAAVRAAAEAARVSLKSKDLSVPPWRKSRYMLAKWFGPYRRTVNALPSSSPAVGGRGREVKCRAVGFEPVMGAICNG